MIHERNPLQFEQSLKLLQVSITVLLQTTIHPIILQVPILNHFIVTHTNQILYAVILIPHFHRRLQLTLSR